MPVDLKWLKKYYHEHEYIVDKVIRRAFMNDRGSRTDSDNRRLARMILYSPLVLFFAFNIVPFVKIFGRLIERGFREASGYGSERANQARDLYNALEIFSIDICDQEQVFLQNFRAQYGKKSFTKNFDDLIKSLISSRQSAGQPGGFFEPATGFKRWRVVERICGAKRGQFMDLVESEALKARLLSLFMAKSLRDATAILENQVRQSGYTYGSSKKLFPIACEALKQASVTWRCKTRDRV
jgi:hypothetical protein